MLNIHMGMKMHFQDDSFTLASSGNLFILVNTGLASLKHVVEIRKIVEAMRQEHPKIATMAVVRVQSADIKAEVRNALSQLLRDMGTASSGTAVVLEGDGFLAGAMRAAASALRLTSRSQYPQKTFANVEEALEWSMQYIAPPPGPGERNTLTRDIMNCVEKVPARQRSMA